jgi:hypothetical protein
MGFLSIFGKIIIALSAIGFIAGELEALLVIKKHAIVFLHLSFSHLLIGFHL